MTERGWSEEKRDVLADITAAVEKAKVQFDYEQQHPKGSDSNPWDLFVPQWVVEIAAEQGETVREVVDRVLVPRWGAINIVEVPAL